MSGPDLVEGVAQAELDAPDVGDARGLLEGHGQELVVVHAEPVLRDAPGRWRAPPCAAVGTNSGCVAVADPVA